MLVSLIGLLGGNLATDKHRTVLAFFIFLSMKRIIYFVFLALALCACGGGDDDDKKANPENNQQSSISTGDNPGEGYVKVTCFSCDASGKCYRCQGSGKYCYKCSGSGICFECNGSLICANCNGDSSPVFATFDL